MDHTWGKGRLAVTCRYQKKAVFTENTIAIAISIEVQSVEHFFHSDCLGL